MSFLVGLIPGGWLTVILSISLAACVLAYIVYRRGKRAGVDQQRAKELKERQAARDIADQVDNDLGVLPTSQKRKELKEWSHED